MDDGYLASNLSNLHDAIGQLSLSSQNRETSKNAHSLKEALGRVKLVSKASRDSSARASTSTYDDQRDDSLALDEQEKLEWIVLGKVTTRTYGLVLENLLQEIIPLEAEISYWEDVITSFRYTSLFSLQTSPIRLWDWSRVIWQDVRNSNPELKSAWREFYARAHASFSSQSHLGIRSMVITPIVNVRRDLQEKQEVLKRLKRRYAAAVGFLLGQGLEIPNTPRNSASAQTDSPATTRQQVAHYLSIMEASIASTTDAFDSNHNQQRDTLQPQLQDGNTSNVKAHEIFARLQSILQQRLPQQTAQVRFIREANGRPSRLIRYWLPAAAFILSSSTLFRIVFNRRADIAQWVRDAGNTAVDFYLNWVVEPGRKLIGTIRHDEGSEVSIMSKQSLEGDRSSLERMVVDFAVQHPEGANLTESQIADIQAKVRAGDLTPVLKAYEKDMQSPIWGGIRGNLIRTLLIQIQKTKVDVEVAMGGIDALLKSQELVFGFISLTPGLLVLVGAYHWLRGLFSSRRSFRKGKSTAQFARLFRNIDRILTQSSHRENIDVLEYESFGMLVCEAVVLRDMASKALPEQVFADFSQDFDDLINLQSGISCQQRVADRMRWAYARWLL